MRPFNTILFLLLTTLISCSTKRKPSHEDKVERTSSLQKIVDNLGHENIIGDNIGIAGSTYRFELFKQLNKIATTNELITLTDHEIPAVRYYSFRALVSRRNDKVFEILLNHMNDTMRLVSFSGCTGMTETLRYNLINIVRSDETNLDGYKLSEKQQAIVDSILHKNPDPIYIPISN